MQKDKMMLFIRHLTYKWIGTPNFIRLIEWRTMLEWLDPKDGERVLDVACGGGVLSLKIAEKECEVHGIDLIEDVISRAKNLAEIEGISCEFEVGNAENLSYPSEYFDLVVCSSALEHFSDDLKALREMNRVLKPNGKLVLTTDSFTYPVSQELNELHKRIAYVVNYYTRETLEEKLKISGFMKIRSKYLLNSRITSFFFRIGIKLRWSGTLWMVTSLVAYPLCLTSDKLFGIENKGFTLIIEAYKPNGVGFT
jgi:ubiquinone/menaquinone biosynthesis C-methylase UbiE